MSGRVKATRNGSRGANPSSRVLKEYEDTQRRREQWVEERAVERAVVDWQRQLGKDRDA